MRGSPLQVYVREIGGHLGREVLGPLVLSHPPQVGV